MEDSPQDVSEFSFVKTFLIPALSILLIPVLSLLFFWHAQTKYDNMMREAALQAIRNNAELTDEERAEAIELFEKVPYSRMMRDPEVAKNEDPLLVYGYMTFRWAIWLSAACIISSIVVFALVGVGVLLSMRSQQMQYISLSLGWHLLRIYGAFQAVVQGALVVALSFWVTAIWFEVYFVKIIFIAALLAICAVGLLIKAIFTYPKNDFAVEGEVLDREASGPLWNELNQICARVGTDPPEHVIAGIDDNFFVTEQTIHVIRPGETEPTSTLNGRTLYVSLSLLKQLNGGEADAVMAHEMAHFSGDDTVFSRKISPLLTRFGHYLQALYEGGITKPIYYFMLCFRAMYEWSLGKLSREREFRADRIATEATSPRDMAGALLRITAYSKYRNGIEEKLFAEEQALESANISEQIEQGFHDYAAKFLTTEKIADLETSHPFDSHPPLDERLAAMSVDVDSRAASVLLHEPGDARWFGMLRDATDLERHQWDAYEKRFRDFHEEVLSYRFLPATAAEQEIVERHFPPMQFEGKKGTLSMDFKQITFTAWSTPIEFSEITGCTMHEGGVLQIDYPREKGKQNLKLSQFGKQQQEVLDQFDRYYSRCLAAKHYQEEKQLGNNVETSS